MEPENEPFGKGETLTQNINFWVPAVSFGEFMQYGILPNKGTKTTQIFWGRGFAAGILCLIQA